MKVQLQSLSLVTPLKAFCKGSLVDKLQVGCLKREPPQLLRDRVIKSSSILSWFTLGLVM